MYKCNLNPARQLAAAPYALCLFYALCNLLIAHAAMAQNPVRIHFQFTDVEYQRNDTLTVAASVSYFKNILGFQFGLNYAYPSLRFFGISKLNPRLNEFNEGNIINDTVYKILRIAWNTPNIFTGESLDDGDTLLHIHFVASCPGGELALSGFNKSPFFNECGNAAGDHLEILTSMSAPKIRINGISKDTTEVRHELIANADNSSFKIRIQSTRGNAFNHLKVIGIQDDSLEIPGVFDKPSVWLSTWVKCGSAYRFWLQDPEGCYLQEFQSRTPDCITGIADTDEIKLYFSNFQRQLWLYSPSDFEFRNICLIGPQGTALPLPAQAKKVNKGLNQIVMQNLIPGMYIFCGQMRERVVVKKIIVL